MRISALDRSFYKLYRQDIAALGLSTLPAIERLREWGTDYRRERT